MYDKISSEVNTRFGYDKMTPCKVEDYLRTGASTEINIEEAELIEDLLEKFL